MRLKNSTALLSAGFATLTAAPALADITADDIWNSYQVIAETVGAELTATTTRDGNKVEITNAKLHFAFPGDTVTFDILYPTLSFADDADGTVSMDLDKPLTYRFVLSAPDQDPFSADLVVNYDDAEMIASGTPNDITFTYGMAELSFELQNLNLNDLEEFENTEFSFMGTSAAINGTSRLSLGDLVTITDQSKIADFGYVMQGKDVQGGATDTTASYANMTSNSTITLPTGGMSIMNLAAALQQGLSIEVASRTGPTSSVAVVSLDGEELSSQTMTSAASAFGISANEKGIEMSGDASQISMEMTASADIPIPLKADIDHVDTTIRIPVSAAEAPQDFTYAFALKGMTLGDEIWALFDPTEILPRDPATVSVDLAGQTTLFQDLLNFTKMMDLSEGDIPLELNTLSIKSLLISAAGASLSGTGDFTFNNDDLVSFDGMPAPTGTADLQVAGVNGLIDRLIQLGLIEETDSMGVRMMMGMFTVPGDGDDSLKSKLEITGDGQILANGQRIK